MGRKANSRSYKNSLFVKTINSPFAPLGWYSPVLSAISALLVALIAFFIALQVAALTKALPWVSVPSVQGYILRTLLNDIFYVGRASNTCYALLLCT